MRTEWMQGYVDSLNDKINLQAYEQSKDYEDGWESATVAQFNYLKQHMQGEFDE
jgi:hypothetical protein